VNWLANTGLSWSISNNIYHSFLLRYFGEQEGAELPNLRQPHVETFDAHTTFDYSFSYDHLFAVRGLILHVDIKNIADAKWQSQSYPTQWPEGLSQGGRSWFAGIEYEF
jgi:outer membrane receptor for ferrienterochelin and colicin